MDRKWTFLGGIGLGATLMYLLEPTAARRRALVRDKSTKLAKRLGRFSVKATRDLANRSRGVAAELYGRARSDNPTGEILAERVRAHIGRAVSTPGAIEVLATDGRVTLRGPVLASELDDLLAAVAHVRGVTGVVNQTNVHQSTDNIPPLQTHGRWRGMSNWPPAAKLLSGLAAGTFAVFAVTRKVA